MNKHSVILADGTKATRNSKNHAYTHAIMVSPLSLEAATEQFTILIESNHAAMVKNHAKFLDIEEHGVKITKETDGTGRTRSRFWVNGEEIFLPVALVLDVNEKQATELAMRRCIKHNGLYAKRHEALTRDLYKAQQAGQWGKWSIVAWCSRKDLAEKQLQRWTGRRGYTASIVEVEVGA